MKYPKDRFDDIPPGLERRGAHRAPRSRGAKIASWLWGLGAVAALVLVGVIGMFVIDNLVSFDQAAEPTPTATESAAGEGGGPEQPQGPPVAQRDGSVPVTVLNGTAQTGVAGDAADTLRGLGWNVATVGDADSEGHDSTVVYYGDPAQEGAALALVQDLGGGSHAMDPAQASPGTIVVVLGADLA